MTIKGYKMLPSNSPGGGGINSSDNKTPYTDIDYLSRISNSFLQIISKNTINL
jgi:hypothetical protein